jgi:hypothetical protein
LILYSIILPPKQERTRFHHFPLYGAGQPTGNNRQKDLKSESSYRRIAITKAILDIWNRQKKRTEATGSDYVFVNNGGRPVLQGKLRELWHRAMEKSGLPSRFSDLICLAF